MTLSAVLLEREAAAWTEVGASMIAVDTLVHNFLHRTGILHRLDATHAYGSACYRPGGCAEIVDAVAKRIDARGSTDVPQGVRSVRSTRDLAVLRPSGLAVCNGNRIHDRKSCDNVYCQIHNICDRKALYNDKYNQ